MDTADPGVTARGRVGALDGLRGAAVAAVLAFHLQYGWARGGFLGVSAFFTLSGFLICSLLLDEHGRTGSISLPRFWSRRARRLLPASLVTLGAIALVWTASSASTSVRTDVVAAVGYVANWRFLVSSQTYAALFQAPSPVLHFWSLAIEEQFYLAFPLVVVGAFRIGRGRVAPVAGVLTALLLGSVAAGLFAAGDDVSRAYYGTDVRAAELLVGALLAVALSSAAIRDRVAPIARAIAPVAVAGLLLAWATVSQNDVRMFRGGLLVHAVAVAIVIAAVVGGGHRLDRALAFAPLRGLGRISYGVYLFHWPLFLWLTPARTGLHGTELAAVRVGATLVLAVASFHLLEEPIRTGRALRLPARARLAGVGAAMAVLAAAVVVLPSFRPAPLGGERVAVAAAPSAPVADLVAEPAAVAEAPAVPTRVYVAGDSVALRLGLELEAWAKQTGRLQVSTSGWLACPAARGGTYRYAGVAKVLSRQCNDRDRVRGAELDSIRPDVVVASYGVFDVLDRRRPGHDRWEHLGDPAYDDYVRSELADLQTLFASRGARVVWLTTPYIRTGGNETGYRPPRPFPEWDHTRMDRYNALVREVAATSPAASVVDVQAHIRAAWGDEEDPAHRPDGIHPSIEATDELITWLAPQLLPQPS